MRSEMLIECTVLRSGNLAVTRMDARFASQLRRLMLYPTELRTAAKTSGLDAIFFIRFGYRSANSKRQELYAHEYKADQRIKSPVPHCWRGRYVMAEYLIWCPELGHSGPEDGKAIRAGEPTPAAPSFALLLQLVQHPLQEDER